MALKDGIDKISARTMVAKNDDVLLSIFTDVCA